MVTADWENDRWASLITLRFPAIPDPSQRFSVNCEVVNAENSRSVVKLNCMVSLGSVPEMDFANLLIVADFKDSAANTVTSNQTMVFELYNDRFHGLMNTQGARR
nr:hypothetical protein Itr_chr11CG09020 [Ipomoea trifida]